MTRQTNPAIQQLTEHIENWRTTDVAIDENNRLVRNVALTGLESRNGYRYSQEALSKAVPLYESKPVFLDHAANSARPYERSTRDLVGHIVNPRFADQRIRADIEVLETEAGRTFMALAGSETPSVGMSHVILAERSRDGSVVEAIHQVISVDAVVFPATTSTFQENTSTTSPLPGSAEALLSAIDAELPFHVRQLAANSSNEARRLGLFAHQLVIEVDAGSNSQPQRYTLPWHVQDGCIVLGEEFSPVSAEQVHNEIGGESFGGLLGDSQTAPSEEDETSYATLRRQRDHAVAERDELREQIKQYERQRQQEQHQAEIDRELDQSNIPNDAISEVWKQQLFEQPSREARQRLIRDREALIARWRRQTPFSRERPHTEAIRTEDQAIIAAIKASRSSVLSGIG